jgi:serine/threonine protein kinase
MQSFASLIHGPEFLILSPWANGRDLHLFLTRPDNVFEDYMERSGRFTPDNLLTECLNLARALDFLHTGMLDDRGRRLKCAHLDLKPENILVCFPPRDRVDQVPVGRWKIADFGLSKVEEAVTEGRVRPVNQDEQRASRAPGNIARERSIQPPTRGAGPFQPPEVHSTPDARVSTRRDVWSYGCILAMVLAFALNGPEGVMDQTARRNTVGSDDWFYRLHNIRHSRPPGSMPGSSLELVSHTVDAELKRPFKRWVDEAHTLADPRHSQWIKHTSKLILALLVPDVTQRPEIIVAVDTLSIIIETTETDGRYRLWDFHSPAIPREQNVVPAPPPDLSHTLPEVDTDAMAYLGHSPASSISGAVLTPFQSPIRDRPPSGSSSRRSHYDPTHSFAKLAAPHKCHGATIEPLGHVAAVWSAVDVKLYSLSPLHTGAVEWNNHSKAATELQQLQLGPIPLRQTSKCVSVQLAGAWLALLEQVTPASLCMRLFRRNTSRDSFYEHQRDITVTQALVEFKLSAFGSLALRYYDCIALETSAGTFPMKLEKEFAGMVFSRTGEVGISP